MSTGDGATLYTPSAYELTHAYIMRGIKGTAQDGEDADRGIRRIQAEAWEAGMVAAKLQALDIKPARNPYLKESK